ncbi:hypothetical protein GHK86_04145, partial [Acidimicrobiaceae bacterium USS-CC1]|nr:hypothetical protein [Acidiferrimicrobium australe]
MMRAVVGSLVVAVAALLTTVVTTSSPAPRTTPLTLYVGPGAPDALRRAAAALDARPTRAADFFNGRSWATLTNPYTERPWTHSGYQMIWGIPMLPASGASLRAGAAGRYDRYWTTMAHQLVAARQAHAILRLGAEFNVPGHPWYAGGQAPAFVAYWRHIVRSMNAVRGAHFAYLWNPNIGGGGPVDAAIGDLGAYYPGNTYVEYV